jgi:hypothetical protein
MKKTILFLVLAALCFAACKKDNKTPVTPVASKKLYKVNFNLNNLQLTINGDPNKKIINGVNVRATEPIAGNFGVLWYGVYTSDNKAFHYFRQDSTLSYFGKITDSLPAGTYTAIIAAGHQQLTYDNGGGVPDYMNYDYLNFGSQAAGISDFFVDKFTFTVGSADLTQNVTLSRRIGELQINIADTIPANARSFKVTINGDCTSYKILTDTIYPPGAPRYFTNTIPASANLKPNYQLESLIGNVGAPFQVQIVCYDGSSNVIVNATISNVICKRNTVTVLTGKLFNNGSSFTVGANDVWSPTPVTIKF